MRNRPYQVLKCSSKLKVRTTGRTPQLIHVHYAHPRERVCLASAEGRKPPSDTQLVEVTSHLKGMRWALRPPHGARAR